MFLVALLLHVLLGVAVISVCLGAPVALAIALVKSPLIMPELDQWWRSEQVRMLENSTTQLAAELAVSEATDENEIIIYPGRAR